MKNNCIEQTNLARLASAWQTAWRTRCCPPVHILESSISDPNMKMHLEICPWCREAARSGGLEAAASASRMLEKLSSGMPVPRPAPGMIFALKPALGTWLRGGRYVNPPPVLILARQDSQKVTVAQVSGTLVFAGPDDVPLGNGLHGFAQPWNTYDIKTESLLMLMADTGDREARSVRAAAIAPQSIREPEPGSAAWFFRLLELETGTAISARSLGDQTQFLSPDFLNSGTLLDDLEKLPVELEGRAGPDVSPDHLLLKTRSAESIIPLAASDNEQKETVNALVFYVSQGHVSQVRAVPVKITFCECQNGFYRVSGRLEIPLPDEGKSHWLFMLDTASGQEYPLPGMSGTKGHLFWASFHVADNCTVTPASLVIRITVGSDQAPEGNEQ